MGDDEMRSEREFNERNIEEFRRNGGKVITEPHGDLPWKRSGTHRLSRSLQWLSIASLRGEQAHATHR
ncbi:MAG: hypothetical protein ACXVX7_06575 [Mycobacterium sp.]